MKRIILTALMLPALVVVLCAPALGADSSAILNDILKKTEAQYKQINGFVADFRQVTTSSAAGTVTGAEAVGKLHYQKPRQMRWEYDKPEKQIFVANRDTAWLYAPAEEQITLFDAKSFFSSPLAQTFFDGIIEVKKHFEVVLDPNQSTKAAAVLKLTPREEDPNIKFLYLWIDLQSYRIAKIETHDVLGNTNRITLDSQKAIDQLDSALFQLEVPQSTAVVDTEGRQLSPSEIDQLKLKLIK